MTEAEWLECNDPEQMLKFLRERVSDRKLRLFACAWCRKVWPLLTDGRSMNAVEVAERFADQLASPKEVATAQKMVKPVAQNLAIAFGSSSQAWRAAKAVEIALRSVVIRWPIDRENSRSQIPLLHDLFSNPFQPLFINPTWLTWNDAMVVRIAQIIYDDRAFDRMPILSDALEDSGCDNAEILSHCRHQEQHFKGCWVVDSLLGMK